LDKFLNWFVTILMIFWQVFLKFPNKRKYCFIVNCSLRTKRLLHATGLKVIYQQNAMNYCSLIHSTWLIDIWNVVCFLRCRSIHTLANLQLNINCLVWKWIRMAYWIWILSVLVQIFEQPWWAHVPLNLNN
jgi:hypothetical protein